MPNKPNPDIVPESENYGLPENFVPVDAPPIIPVNIGAAQNPYLSGSIPSNLNLQPDLIATGTRGGRVPVARLMPVQGNPAVNAQTQSIVETAIAAIPPTVIPTVTQVSDNLTHGTATIPWESDPAYNLLRDDFQGNYTGTIGNSVPLLGIGQLGWILGGTVGTEGGFVGGSPPNLGSMAWSNGATASNNGLLILASGQSKLAGSNAMNEGAWALFENPGWWLTWVFQLSNSWVASSTATTTTKKAIYVGLVGPNTYEEVTSSTMSRPPIFFGLRYDTDPGVSFAVTAATAGSGNYSLTGTFTNGGTNNFNGQTFVVTGFSHPNNNGTFLCIGSTASTLTLANASGGTNESATAAAHTPVLNDAFWTLEAVVNAEYPTGGQIVRNNTQGFTYVTNVAPAPDIWHRLDIYCSSSGSITMALDGSTTNTLTCTVPQYTWTATATENLSGSLTNNVISLSASPLNPAALGPWGPGSEVTVAGFTGTQAYFNSTWTVNHNYTGSTAMNLAIDNTHVNIGAASKATATITGYPIVMPGILFGNDSETPTAANELSFYADYFSFIWNTALSTAGGTPSPSNPRYLT